MKRMLVFVSLTLVAAPAAAETFTRAGALERAMAQNPQVAAARAQVAAAEAQKDQADAARWPIINLEAGVAPALQAELVPGTAVQSVEDDDFELSDLTVVFGANASVIQPLYTFGKIGHRRDAAAAGIRAREAQAEMTRAEVALEVARLYEGYLFAREALLFFEQVEHSLERSIESTRERLDVETPTVTEQDLLRLQSALSLALLGKHRARAGLRQAEAGLRAYLDVPEGESLELAPTELAPLASAPVDVDLLIAEALDLRPELDALDFGAEAFEDLAEAERAGYYPDVVAIASLWAAYTPGRDELDTRFVTDEFNRFTPAIILGLRWQFQGPSPGARADERRAEAAQLARKRDWARQALPAEVTLHYEDVQRARADIDSAAEGFEQAKEWVVRASADYAIGLGDSDEVTDATSAWASLRTAQLEAIYRHNVALAELARATGTLRTGSTLYPGDQP